MTANFQCSAPYTASASCSTSKKGLLGLLGLLGLIPLLICLALLCLLLLCFLRRKKKGTPVNFATFDPECAAVPTAPCVGMVEQQSCFAAAPLAAGPGIACDNGFGAPIAFDGAFGNPFPGTVI